MIETPRVTLRRARRSDLPLLFAWRQNAEVVRWLPSFTPVTWEQHVAWWRARHNRTDYMVLLWSGNQARPVGTVHALDLDHTPEVGIVLGDTSAWGKGVGKLALALLLLRPEVRRCNEWVYALIHPDNVASQHVFVANGFRKVTFERDGVVTSGGRNGQWIYQWRRFGRIEVTGVPGHVVHLPATGEAM